MTLFRIGTFAQNQFSLAKMLQVQSRVFDANIQISSGAKAQRYSGISVDAKRVVTLEDTLVKTNGFVQTNSRIDDRLQTMESQTTGMFEVATKFRSTLIQALSADNAKDLDLVNNATSLLDQVASLLNAREDGQYVFSGGRMDQAPVDLNAAHFLTPLTTYPSTASSIREAGTGAGALSAQGYAVAFNESTVTSGDGFRLSYDYTNATTGSLTVTNITSGASQTINVATQLNALVATPGDNLAAGQSSNFDFDTLGVTVTLDNSFVRNADNITTGTLDAAAIGADITFTALTVANGTTGIGIDAVQAVQNLPPAVFDRTTGLLTITANTDGATVEFSAAGVDLGDGVGAGITDRVGNGTANIVVGGHTIATISYTNIATGGGTDGTFTVDIGKLMVSQSTPGYYQGDDRALKVRVDESSEITYGITAKEVAFENLIRGLKLMATNPTLDPARMQEAKRLVDQAIENIPDIISRIGLDRANIVQFNQTHQNTILYTKEVLGKIKNVDIADALLRMQADQTALEAAFTTIAQLRNSTLLNFL